MLQTIDWFFRAELDPDQFGWLIATLWLYGRKYIGGRRPGKRAAAQETDNQPINIYWPAWRYISFIFDLALLLSKIELWDDLSKGALSNQAPLHYNGGGVSEGCT